MANRKLVVSGGGSAAGPVDATPAANRGRTKTGTGFIASASPAQSLTFNPGITWTPAGVHCTGHDNNVFGTVQSWSSSAITVTLRRWDGSTSWSSGFTWSAFE